VVLALIGLFLVRAALDFDPNKAVGVDGALHQLADRPFGTVALVIVALGLFAYGLFSFVEARWRKVME
jgi:ABC-type Na+ efflux pump permease subunit